MKKYIIISLIIIVGSIVSISAGVYLANLKSDSILSKYNKVDEAKAEEKTQEVVSENSYVLTSSNKSNERVGFWFGRNKDFIRPNAPLSVEAFKEYNSYYLGKDEKVIYLTFDEGLNNTQASKNLDTLKKYNIKAAFFVTNNFIESNPELVKRMKDEGHVVGNHTVNHLDMSKVALDDPNKFISELKTTEETFKKVTGYNMDKVLRFPEGTFSELALDYSNQLGYKSFFWSFAYKDWNADWNTKDEALNWMKSYYHPGAIYLLHGVNKSNADALEEFIVYMKSQDYKFDLITNI